MEHGRRFSYCVIQVSACSQKYTFTSHDISVILRWVRILTHSLRLTKLCLFTFESRLIGYSPFYIRNCYSHQGFETHQRLFRFETLRIQYQHDFNIVHEWTCLWIRPQLTLRSLATADFRLVFCTSGARSSCSATYHENWGMRYVSYAYYTVKSMITDTAYRSTIWRWTVRSTFEIHWHAKLTATVCLTNIYSSLTISSAMSYWNESSNTQTWRVAVTVRCGLQCFFHSSMRADYHSAWLLYLLQRRDSWALADVLLLNISRVLTYRKYLTYRKDSRSNRH